MEKVKFRIPSEGSLGQLEAPISKKGFIKGKMYPVFLASGGHIMLLNPQQMPSNYEEFNQEIIEVFGIDHFLAIFKALYYMGQGATAKALDQYLKQLNGEAPAEKTGDDFTCSVIKSGDKWSICQRNEIFGEWPDRKSAQDSCDYFNKCVFAFDMMGV